MGSTGTRRLRVLTLVDRPITSGGGERVASMVAMHLDPDRFDRYLCSSRSGDAETFEEQLHERGVRVLVVDRGSPANLLAWRPLVDLIRKERIDVLHAHKFGSNVWGSVIGRLARVPVVVAHEHSWSYEGNPVRRMLDRHVVARLADAFVAVSPEDKRRMMEIEHVPESVIRLIPNGIPAPVLTGRDMRGELGLSETDVVVVTVAQLRPEKALDVLVDAAAIVAVSDSRVRVVIVGGGPEEGALRNRVRAAGLDAAVILAGHRSDVPDILAAADIAVCCSDFEGMPLSVIEYMAASLPVVATDVGGLPIVVEDGRTGLLVPPRNADVLAGAIARLAGDEALRESLGAAGRAEQLARYDFGATVATISDLYEELYARSRRGRSEGWAAGYESHSMNRATAPD